MESIKVSGGIAEEAVEIGLQHAVAEEKLGRQTSIPLKQVFLIGDAPPNPNETVVSRRGNQSKWQGSNFDQPVYWD